MLKIDALETGQDMSGIVSGTFSSRKKNIMEQNASHVNAGVEMLTKLGSAIMFVLRSVLSQDQFSFMLEVAMPCP